MKRKRLLLLLNMALLAACALLLWNNTVQKKPIIYDVAGPKHLEKIAKNYEQTSEPILQELRFNQVGLVEDKATATFYLPLNMQESAWETGELSSGQPEVELFFEREFTRDDKLTAIRQGTRYKFLAVSGRQYRICYLVFTGLPILGIETEETAETEVFGGTIRFWEADSKQDWAYSNILEAHIRGNTSRLYPKKGYKLTLKEEDREGKVVKARRALFGLREDDEFILNAMYTDASKLRDKLSADIWGELGAKASPWKKVYLGTRMTYTEVFFNGEYWGLYALVEPVDSKQLDLNKEGGDKTVEYSYKSYTPQNISNLEFQNSPFWTEDMAGYKLKGSYSSIDKTCWQPLLDYLNWRDDPDDQRFADEAKERVSIDNLMRIWLCMQASMAIDNRVKNMYYVAKNEGDSYRMYLALWDMDLTFGDTLQDSRSEYPWSVGNNPAIYRERINYTAADRLLELDVGDSRQKVSEVWKEAREGALSAYSLRTRIDELEHLVNDSGAMARDKWRWPRSRHDEDYEKMKTLLCYRMEILDRYLYDDIPGYLELGYQ